MPHNTAAYLTSGDNGTFEVKEAPYVKPGAGEVVIRNSAVAVNPLDIKIQAIGKFFPLPKEYPARYRRRIFEVGEGVAGFKKGDRVVAFANWMVGGSSNGGFQNYTVAKASIVSHLPDHIPYAAGVVLPLALMTASMALYPVQRLGLSLPSCPSTQEAQSRNKTLLVWGGSSSAGSAAVQLAVASGVNVVATTSHKNHELVKSLGATAVLDYNDPDITVNLVEAITAIGAELVGALDSIASEKTAKGFDSGIPDDVEVLPMTDAAAIGFKHDIIEGIWGRFVPEALRDGSLKTFLEPIVAGKGLGAVADGVDLLKTGVSAGKLL